MRMFLGMMALAFLLDGAMVLHHEHAQHANAVEQTVALTADASDSGTLAQR